MKEKHPSDESFLEFKISFEGLNEEFESVEEGQKGFIEGFKKNNDVIGAYNEYVGNLDLQLILEVKEILQNMSNRYYAKHKDLIEEIQLLQTVNLPEYLDSNSSGHR